MYSVLVKEWLRILVVYDFRNILFQHDVAWLNVPVHKPKWVELLDWVNEMQAELQSCWFIKDAFDLDLLH